MEIGITNQLDLNGWRVQWRARIDGEWRSGAAESIRAAIDAIENESANL